MTVTLQARAAVPPRPKPSPAWAIGRLAAPLSLFFFIQSGVSMTGLAMLGRLGNAALAAVGAGGAVFGVFLAVLYGVDAAVQATISRAVGAGLAQRQAQSLLGALILSVPLGAFLAGGLWLAAPAILPAMIPHSAVAALGVSYARAAAPSLVFFAVTIPINASWIGAGRPGIAFLVTALTAPIQILATFVFIFGAGVMAPQGAAGSGWGTTFAALAGIFIQLALATAKGGPLRDWRANLGHADARAIASLGWPISVQQALLQVGLMVAFVIVGRLGVAQVAAANVLVSLSTVPLQLAAALGMAAATLVGQALGRGETAEARRWGWRAAGGGLALFGPLGLLALLAPGLLLRPFLRDPATLALAVTPLRILGLGIVADASARILCFAIRGAGATRTGAAIPFASQWLLQLPLSWLVAVRLGFGLTGLTAIQTVISLGELAVTAVIWVGSSWASPRALKATVEPP